jgi:MFS family permease
LVVARLIQGLAVGGEWGGAVVMALEHAPENKKSFYASWPQAGVPAGVLLSSGAFFLVQLMPEEQLTSFGWRIPFLFSALLVGFGLYIRLKITESPEFLEMKADELEHKVPLAEVLKTSKKSLIIGILALTGSNTLFYISTVYLLSYGPENTGIARGDILLAISLGALLDVIAIPAVAILADRHGRKKLLQIGSAITAVAAIPIFLLINIGSPLGAYLALILALPIAHSFVYATISGFIAMLFKPSVRYTGSSLAYQMSGIVSSAPAPILAVFLFAESGTFVAVAVYLIVANVIAFVAISFAAPDHRAEEQADEPVMTESIGS